MKLLSKQKGIALLVFATVLAAAASTVALNVLKHSSGNTQIARDRITAAALAQAKDALIGYAAKDLVRPGELPCPDINNDGIITITGPNADYSGSNCISLIGRLPWRTLGLSDLRDGAGERLWYAVSDAFHANSSTVLNSDTHGTLTVRDPAGNIINNGCSAYVPHSCPNPGTSDAAFGTGAIAVIFAPGEVITRQGSIALQDRSSAGINTASNYLDIATVGGLVEDNANFTGGNSSNGFVQETKIYNPVTKIYVPETNDKLTVITHDNLFPAVEKMVAKRVRNELFNVSRTFWRPYPFAALFNNSSDENSFVSTTGTTYGLLPRHAVWAGIPNASLNGGSAAVSCNLHNGDNSLVDAQARCDISLISGNPIITINGTLTPSLGLWRQYDLTSSGEVRIKVKVKHNSCAEPDPSGDTKDCASSAVPGFNASINYTVNADGSVTVTFTGSLNSAITRIELRDVVTDSAYNWLTQNEWHKVMYYAISPGYVPGGINDCEPLGTVPHVKPYCLTVNGARVINDAHAIVITTGQAISGIHPSSTLDNYLERENASPANFIYENSPRSSSFNDQVIIVAP